MGKDKRKPPKTQGARRNLPGESASAHGTLADEIASYLETEAGHAHLLGQLLVALTFNIDQRTRLADLLYDAASKKSDEDWSEVFKRLRRSAEDLEDPDEA